jgi:hypothetical protein
LENGSIRLIFYTTIPHFPSPALYTLKMEERVELLAPDTKKEHALAQVMQAFSNFVFYEERESCLVILRMQKHSEEVGELQGGNDDYSIYRVVITNHPKDAVSELLNLFVQNTHSRNTILTKDSLQQYMLGMCGRFSDGAYTQLSNLMLVFSFGKTDGQVRHIDHTHPNAMVCMYMSQECPSTIVYSSSYGSISNCEELLDHWQDGDCHRLAVPNLVKDILVEQEHTDLSHSYFAFWKTLQHQLENFGKLYLPQDEISVCDQSTGPGATLIAGGNAVHAGPPTNGPRMFAYAIGVYNDEDDNDNDGKDGKINDGEVQYSPALLQLDLCCLVLGWMRDEYADRMEEHLEVKQFMVSMLVDMILDMQKQHGNETYARSSLLGDDRSQAIEWIGRVVQAGANDIDFNGDDIDALIQQGVAEGDRIFAIPDVVVMLSSTKRRQRDRKKKLRKERQPKTT